MTWKSAEVWIIFKFEKHDVYFLHSPEEGSVNADTP